MNAQQGKLGNCIFVSVPESCAVGNSSRAAGSGTNLRPSHGVANTIRKLLGTLVFKGQVKVFAKLGPNGVTDIEATASRKILRDAAAAIFGNGGFAPAMSGQRRLNVSAIQAGREEVDYRGHTPAVNDFNVRKPSFS